MVQALPPELSSQALAEMPEEDARRGHARRARARSRRRRSSRSWRTTTRPTSWASSSRADQERILSEVEDRAEVDRLLALRRGDRRRPDDHPHGDRARHGHRGRGARGDPAAGGGGRGLLPGVRGGRRPAAGGRAAVQGPGGQPAASAGCASSWRPADVSVRPSWTRKRSRELLARYNLPSVAVVDEAGRLLGRITFDDVIDVVEAETTEDLLRFGGVPAGEELAAGWRDAVRSRLPVALPQPAHRVPGRRRGLPVPGHGAAHRGARRLDADHRRHGRQRRHPGARGHGAPARARPHPEPPVRARGREGSARRDRQRPRHRRSSSASSRPLVGRPAVASAWWCSSP